MQLARPTSQHFVNPTNPHLHHQQQHLETLKCEMGPSLDAGRVCSSDDETMGGAHLVKEMDVLQTGVRAIIL